MFKNEIVFDFWFFNVNEFVYFLIDLFYLINEIFVLFKSNHNKIVLVWILDPMNMIGGFKILFR